LSPGDQLKITYVNELPSHPQASCAITPCMDMTNLHFHGLTVSPDAPQDDVLSMMATPGQSLHYTVQIPKDHSPGLYWYHTHPHGDSYRQVLDGMSGALVIDTVSVGYGGSVDVIMDFTDPVIKGMSVFHCHLLNHEDKGMMAKILFQ
jgi:FtsP/CotA-like multicopper oxidase with cupredoxin domain